MKLFCLILLVFISSFSVNAQKGSSISGVIKDNTTGETLIGATVQVKELPNIVGVSNSYGFYTINLPAGSYTLLLILLDIPRSQLMYHY